MERHIPFNSKSSVPLSRESGISLIEMVVSIMLVGMLVLILHFIFGTTMKMQAELSDRESLLRELRFTTDTIRREWIRKPYQVENCSNTNVPNCFHAWKDQNTNNRFVFTMNSTDGLQMTFQENGVDQKKIRLASFVQPSSVFIASQSQLEMNWVLKKGKQTLNETTYAYRTNWATGTSSGSLISDGVGTVVVDEGQIEVDEP